MVYNGMIRFLSAPQKGLYLCGSNIQRTRWNVSCLYPDLSAVLVLGWIQPSQVHNKGSYPQLRHLQDVYPACLLWWRGWIDGGRDCFCCCLFFRSFFRALLSHRSFYFSSFKTKKSSLFCLFQAIAITGWLLTDSSPYLQRQNKNRRKFYFIFLLFVFASVRKL